MAVFQREPGHSHFIFCTGIADVKYHTESRGFVDPTEPFYLNRKYTNPDVGF